MTGPSLKWGNPLQRSPRLHSRPVCLKISTVKAGPLLDQAEGSLRPDVADDQLPTQVKLRLLTLMLSMEVGGLVVLVEHADHDAKKRRDDRHALNLQLRAPKVGPTHGSAAGVRRLQRARQLHPFVLRHPRILAWPIQAIEPRPPLWDSARPSPVVSLTRRACAADPYGGPPRLHCSVSTLMACKGRDAPFSALALRTGPVKTFHFHAPRTGRGAALGLRPEAPARIFTIPNPTAFVFAHRARRTLR